MTESTGDGAAAWVVRLASASFGVGMLILAYSFGWSGLASILLITSGVAAIAVPVINAIRRRPDDTIDS